MEKLFSYIGILALAVLAYLGYKRTKRDDINSGTGSATKLATDSKAGNTDAIERTGNIVDTGERIAESIVLARGSATSAGSAIDNALDLIEQIRARANVDTDGAGSGDDGIDSD